MPQGHPEMTEDYREMVKSHREIAKGHPEMANGLTLSHFYPTLHHFPVALSLFHQFSVACQQRDERLAYDGDISFCCPGGFLSAQPIV